MKKNLLLLILILGAFVSHAQMKTLLVNDNGVNPDNTTTILKIIDETGFEYDFFDAVAESRSPLASEMESYNLVIWYMSSDGVGRYFWNGNDIDNEEIMKYLDQGGWMWVIGTDFMYDRYTTPSLFKESEFPFDYLGVQEYHAQSYADDGLEGVQQLNLTEEQKILTLDPVRWVFPTLWYADAVVAAEKTIPVYMMGPEDYVFSDYAAGIYKDDNYKILSFFFDPALIDTDANLLQMFTEVLKFFILHVDVPSIQATHSKFQAYTSSLNDILHVKFAPPLSNVEPIMVHDVQGRLVFKSTVSPYETETAISISGWSHGTYILSIGDQKIKIVNGRN